MEKHYATIIFPGMGYTLSEAAEDAEKLFNNSQTEMQGMTIERYQVISHGSKEEMERKGMSIDENIFECVIMVLVSGDREVIDRWRSQ